MTRPSTTIGERELGLLKAAVASLGIDEVEGEALHLDVDETGRRWIVESAEGQMTIHAYDPAPTEGPLEGSFAISERIRRFAECFAGDTLGLTVADGATAVATVGEGPGAVTVAVDLVVGRGEHPEPWILLPSATAVVPARELVSMLIAIRTMPQGLQVPEYPMPPMWMQIGDGSLGLHVDWSDFLPSRGTYRIAASATEGSTTVAIPHGALEALLRHTVFELDDTDDLTIRVGAVLDGTEYRDAIGMSGEDWNLVLWAVQPLELRWGTKVTQLLTDDGLHVLDRDDAEWVVSTGRSEARVVLHHGHPDIARVSALLLEGAEDHLDLLRELNQLNAASTGVRFWFEHGSVHAAADVRCTELGSLATVVRHVGDTAADLAPVLATLATST